MRAIPLAVAAALLISTPPIANAAEPSSPETATVAPTPQSAAEGAPAKPRLRDLARERLKAFLTEQPGQPAPVHQSQQPTK